MSRRIRSRKTYVVSGWTIRVSHPMVLGHDCWSVSRDGASARYYDLLSEARRAAERAGPTGELTGGTGVV